MTLFEVLALRHKYEMLVDRFSLPSRESDIDSIMWFIKNGHKSNRLRNGYGEAKEIATIIKEYYYGGQRGHKNLRRDE